MTWKCPCCEGNKLNIITRVAARLHQSDDNFETEVFGDHEWDDESFAWCDDCHYDGPIKKFEVNDPQSVVDYVGATKLQKMTDKWVGPFDNPFRAIAATLDANNIDTSEYKEFILYDVVKQRKLLTDSDMSNFVDDVIAHIAEVLEVVTQKRDDGWYGCYNG